MNLKHKIIESGAMSKAHLYVGVIIGLLIGILGTILYDRIEDLIYDIPNQMLCRKGIAYEAVEYGSNIYLKTGQHCVDTTFGEEMK